LKLREEEINCVIWFSLSYEFTHYIVLFIGVVQLLVIQVNTQK
jgi:hypothetical protein